MPSSSSPPRARGCSIPAEPCCPGRYLPIIILMGDLARPRAGTSPLDSPRLRAQAGAAMWAGGGAFCLIATVFPAKGGWQPGTAVVAAGCIFSAVIALITGERWSFRFWVAIRFVSNLFVAVAIYSMGPSPDGGEIFYLWTILFGFIFFSRRQGIFQTAQAGVMLAVNFALRPPDVSPLELWVLFIGSFTGAGLVVAWLKERLESVLHQNRLDAVTDSLTGLGNRRRLMDDLAHQIAELREGSQLALALFDLDGFKSYNDRFGHLAGDTLLAGLGERLAHALDGSGHAYRFGGDEF